MASNPTLTFQEGDRINLNVDEATGHPFYIKTTDTTGSGDQVSGVTNNGTVDGMVIWQTQGGDAGTYYYKCGNHAAMGGTIVIQSSAPLPGYNIDVTAADNDDYTLLGKDSTGNISGDDIDVTIYEGNRVNFLVDAAGHPFYIKSTAGSGTGNQVSGVTGQGLESGTTYWIPPIGSAGTYYYQCGNHTAMSGKLIVLGSNTPGNPSYGGKTSNGGPLTMHTSAFLDIEKAGPYFTGSVPIKFSQMRSYFKEKTTGSVSAKELRRNINDLERDPIVPDSTENSAVADTISYNWKTSQFRGSIKRYYATTNSSGTTSNTIPNLSLGRFSGDNGADWSNGGTQGVDSINKIDGNVARNVQKHIYVTKVLYSGDMGTGGNYGSGQNGKDKVPACRLIPSEPNNAAVPAHNVRMYVENSGAIYGSAGLGGWHQSGGYTNGTPKKSDPGKDGGTALKIIHTGSQTDIFLQENAKVWGGGGGGEQGSMGELIGSSMEDMKHDCIKSYNRDGAGCGVQPVCDAGDEIESGTLQEVGPCGPDGTQQTYRAVCKNVTKSTAPVQGIGGKGGDGAGWAYTQFVGGGPTEENDGASGTINECGVCPPGTQLTGGNCSSVGGDGGDGGDWGKGGQATQPLETGEPYDAGKGGSAICGLNPDTNQKNWVIGGTISDNTLKGNYQTGGCDGSSGGQPPIVSPPNVTVTKDNYVRFGDDAGTGSGGYGSNGAANLLVTSNIAGNTDFRIKYSWNDEENRKGIALSHMEVAGRMFTYPSSWWQLSYNNPFKSPGMENNWSEWMKEYAIFPADTNQIYNPVHTGPYYPDKTLADEVWSLRYEFEVRSGNTSGFRLYAQADNRAQFNLISKAGADAGNGSVLIGEVAEFSNPGENGDILDLTFSSTDPRFSVGKHYLDVTIKNSKFPAGQEPNPGANDDWAYNPGGVAFALLDLDRDDWDDKYVGNKPNYMVSSFKRQGHGLNAAGSMTHNFNLTPGAWPIEWSNLNTRNSDAGKDYPNASRMRQNGQEIQLLDDDNMDANGTFQILKKLPVNGVDEMYGPTTISWDGGNNVTSLTGTATPNDPTFQFSGLSGSDGVQPMSSTTYKFIGIGPGGTDIEEVTVL